MAGHIVDCSLFGSDTAKLLPIIADLPFYTVKTPTRDCSRARSRSEVRLLSEGRKETLEGRSEIIAKSEESKASKSSTLAGANSTFRNVRKTDVLRYHG